MKERKLARIGREISAISEYLSIVECDKHECYTCFYYQRTVLADSNYCEYHNEEKHFNDSCEHYSKYDWNKYWSAVKSVLYEHLSVLINKRNIIVKDKRACINCNYYTDISEISTSGICKDCNKEIPYDSACNTLGWP